MKGFSSPKAILGRITDVSRRWGELRPTKSYSGLTLEQFKQAVQPSLDVRAEIAELEGRLQEALQRRTAVDKTSVEVVRGVVNAVKSDREDGGEDGSFYAALGFVTASARSSGLTRRRASGNGSAKAEETS